MNRNAGLFRLLKFYMYTIICIHISSCIWFLLAQASSFTPDVYIAINLLFIINLFRHGYIEDIVRI